MENKKVTKFTNFNYVVLPTTDPKYVDVQVKFKYNGEQALHVVSFRKAPGKSNSFYIDKAKAKMAQYEKRGRLEKIATKSISASKDTFYQRHKKGMNALFAVVAVGAVAGGTAAILINCLPKPDQTVVTEEEIDKYLEIPTGKTEFIGAAAGKVIINQVLDNLLKYDIRNDGDFCTTNLNHIDMKLISSQSYYRDIGKVNYEPHYPIEPEDSMMPNDLTGFYTNNSFKNKRYYATYIGGSLTKGKTTIDITAKDKLCSTINGVDSTSNIITKDLFTYDRTVDGYRQFIYTKFSLDNYSAPNLESYRPGGTYSSKKDVEDYFVFQVGQIAGEFTMADYLSHLQSYLLKAEDGTVYYATMNERQISESLPSSIYPDKKEPIFNRSEAIWRFKNTPEFGWVLDSYAQDGSPNSELSGVNGNAGVFSSFYVYHNEKGETLEKPFAIHKNKRLVKLSYGEREEVSKEASEMKFKHNKDFLDRYELQSVYFDINGSTATPVGPIDGKDMTLIHRVEDHNFDGIDLNVAIYNPQRGISSENEGFICVVRDNETDTPVIYDYNEMIKYIKDESAKTLIEEGPIVSSGGNSYTVCKITKTDGWYSVNFVFNNKQKLDEIKIEWNEGSYIK